MGGVFLTKIGSFAENLQPGWINRCARTISAGDYSIHSVTKKGCRHQTGLLCQGSMKKMGIRPRAEPPHFFHLHLALFDGGGLGAGSIINFLIT